MAPRRMDGFARPAGSQGQRPAPQPRPAQPRPMPAQQPMRPAARPQRPMPVQGQRTADPRMAPGYDREQYQAPTRQQLAATHPNARMQRGYAQPEEQLQHDPAKKRRRKGGGWKVVLQFVIGLAVIVIVAAAIVWLYVRYYQ